MYIVLDNRESGFIQILGEFNSYNEALGKAFSFVSGIIHNYEGYNISKAECDFRLKEINPKGQEFIIKTNRDITHVQILPI